MTEESKAEYRGWHDIAKASGFNPNTLSRYSSLGILPVQPTKVGNRVVMTAAQVELLKRGVK